VVYLDNIFIFTKTVKEYARAVWRVLEVLAKHNLFLYLKKYEFQKEQIQYLELVISQDKISMDPIKVAGVSE